MNTRTLVLAAVIALSAVAADAQTTDLRWVGNDPNGPNNWFVANNWNDSGNSTIHVVPGPTTSASVYSTASGPGSYNDYPIIMGSGDAQCTTLYVGKGYYAWFTQSGGTVTASQSVQVAGLASSGGTGVATYDMQAGHLTTPTLYVGYYLKNGYAYITAASMALRGGVVDAPTVQIGANKYGQDYYGSMMATLDMLGGTLNTSQIQVQNGGCLILHRDYVNDLPLQITGGTLDLTNHALRVDGTHGSMNVHSGYVYASTADVGAVGTGAYIQDGGDMATTSLTLGRTATGVGSYTLTGHTPVGSGNKMTPALDVSTFVIGDAGQGTAVMDWGTATIADSLILGKSGTGTGSLTLGKAAAAPAGATVVAADIYVGLNGTGTVTQTAGTVQAGSITLGFNAGSTGSYAVNGGTAVVTDLYVGMLGGGTVTQSAGMVQAGSMSLGFNAGSTGSYAVSGGTAAVADLYVGRQGGGTLTVASGGAVSGSNSYLGNSVGSSGTATVTGPGSNWTISGSLVVGQGGPGTLTVANGGAVSSSAGYLGYNSLSSGTAVVTGSGSTWTSTDLFVGRSGASSLTVENGGTLNAKTLYASPANLYGDGTINANGLVSDLDLVFDATHGASQVLAYGTGGTLNLNLDGTGNLGVGYRGTGTILVADGVTIASSSGYLGYNALTSGTAVVTGPGSTWTSTNLFVGRDGAGTLRVENSGTVNAKMLYASAADLKGDGTINTQGLVADFDLVFDATHGASQALPFGTGGVLNLNLDGTGDLGVGYHGAGTLRIDSGTITSTSGYLGYNAGSSGTATVSGTAMVSACWTNTGTLYVGYAGTGTLTIRDGGWVTTQNLRINSKSTVKLYVSGGSLMAGSSRVKLGDKATGNPGSIANDGKINIYADAFMAAGTYLPIYSSMGTATGIAWSGTGSRNSFGGVWDNAGKYFTVAAAAALESGASDAVTTGERLLITDSGTGKRVGASFGSVAAGTNFQADLLGEGDLSGLIAALPADHGVLAAWNFTTNFAGGETLLSFYVGAKHSDLAAWRYDGAAWTAFDAPDLAYYSDTYSLSNIASFSVTGFSGYALTGFVPPPPPPPPPPPQNAGDANNDGTVDVVDLGILAKNYDGTGKAWETGDFNGDGFVDVVDLGILARNYDWAGAPAGAVPEPACLALLLAGAAALRRRR